MKLFALKRIPHEQIQVMRGRELAEGYLRMQEKFARVYRRFAGFVAREGRKGTFLEIGCGPGYQTILIGVAHPEARICVLEPSSDMLATAKANAERHGLSHRVQFVQGYVEDEELLNSLGRFDMVYSSFSLHHWVNPVRAFANIARVLKPDGVALIYDVERRWLAAHLPFLPQGAVESVRASYTQREVAAMLGNLRDVTWQIERHFLYLLVRLRQIRGVMREKEEPF